MIKILKITMFAAFFLISGSALFAQDEIYNEKSKKKTIEKVQVVNNNDVIPIEEYSTQADYNLKQRGKKGKQTVQTYTVNNVDDYNETKTDNHKCKDKNCCVRDTAVEVAAQIVIEVFVQAAFSLLLGSW